jgi:hypothetical protein
MIKAKLLKLCVVCMIAFTSVGFAEIHQVSKVEEMKNYMEEMTSSDLAVFDVDMVLIHPSDPAFQMANMYRHGKKVKEIMEELNSLEKDIFWNLINISGEASLVDEQILPLLGHLKSSKVKSMALTAGLTGSFEKINSMEEWRYNRLKQLGIDFSESFSGTSEVLLVELPMYRGHYATFKNGILFANGEKNPTGKGATLNRFLEKVNFKPKKIVFIDDRLENLRVVEETLKKDLSISFVGLHYVGAKEFPSEKVDEDSFVKKYKEIAHKAKTFH